jgi:DNA-directed RNA polymerase subunit RPC12/RpoP
VKRPPHLTVVPTEPVAENPVTASRARIKAMPKPGDMIQCPRCGGREVIETRIGILRRPNGSSYGGTRAMICAACHRNGERVVV